MFLPGSPELLWVGWWSFAGIRPPPAWPSVLRVLSAAAAIVLPACFSLPVPGALGAVMHRLRPDGPRAE